MERLTQYILGYAHGRAGRRKECLSESYCRGEFEATAIVEKLAKYEDLEERLEKLFGGSFTLKDIVDSIEHCFGESGDPYPINARILTCEDAEKWERWKQLNEQGRLKELPCDVGAEEEALKEKEKK